MKLNLLKPRPKVPLGCERMCHVYNWVMVALIVFGWTVVGFIIFQHASHDRNSVPTTVLNGVVIDVRDGEVAALQLIRGESMFGSTISFSRDKGSWKHELPISCNELGVQLVYVRPAFRSWAYETVIIVEDNTEMCDELGLISEP